jgi:hypothetical protein
MKAMMWVGVALMVVSALVGVTWYHNYHLLVGCVIFFVIGLIILFAGAIGSKKE